MNKNESEKKAIGKRIQNSQERPKTEESFSYFCFKTDINF